MKLLMLMGLPASGKSTYAKQLALDGWVRVNKDDLRAMLHGGKWSPKNEKQILQVRDQVISDSLLAGKSVVVDDTNLDPKHKIRLQELAKKYAATFETKFFDVEPAECIKRDLVRPNSVGNDVIMGFYNKYLAPAPEVYEPPHGKPRAIICDIDGTLAHMGERSPYDWHKVGSDTVDQVVIDLLRRYDNRVIILLSGRDSVCRTETVQWLEQNRVPFNHLFMRPEKDMRKDSIVKRELFEQHIRNDFNVEFVLDDRQQVVDMWRQMGLKCLQVAKGDF